MSGAGRRELTAAVAGCAVAAALALSAGGQAWATVEVQRRPPLPPVVETVSGSALAALVPACALVVLAAAVALVAVRGTARVAVGLLTAVAGGVLAWSGLRVLVAGLDAADLPDGGGASDTGLAVDVHTAWPLLTALAGVLAVAAAVLTVLRGRGWAAMGRRYERSAGAAEARSRPRTDDDVALDAWRALDRGEDPTEEALEPPTRPPDGAPGSRL
ncbi:Trp biosynthesis-associated membrane protein [Blastococcus sp. SYSU D00820]